MPTRWPRHATVVAVQAEKPVKPELTVEQVHDNLDDFWNRALWTLAPPVEPDGIAVSMKETASTVDFAVAKACCMREFSRGVTEKLILRLDATLNEVMERQFSQTNEIVALIEVDSPSTKI